MNQELINKDKDDFKVIISEIIFSTGSKVKIKSNEKIIIVGSNNSGKSQSLREIMLILENGPHEKHIIIKDLVLNKSGSFDMKMNVIKNSSPSTNGWHYIGDAHIHESHAKILTTEKYLKNSFHKVFAQNIEAQKRLSICEQQDNISDETPASKPQHYLYRSQDLSKKISKLFKQSFGSELLINYRGGSKIPIHVCKEFNHSISQNQVSDDYVNELKKSPLLDKQGDGIKSYAGILFEAIATEKQITLIDEPEAFLHPPQMRKLGETLSSEVEGQLFVATHSSDILRGFMEGTKGNIRILRIRREGNKNFIHEAAPETIKKLWEKPQLKYSNALESIFHEQAIICEDDSDCRLINAVADHLEKTHGNKILDTAYIPSGGKHAIPKIASTLRNIGVPIKAVFDIDFLSDENLIKETVIAFGGQWEEFQALYRNLNSAVCKGVAPKSNQEIKDEIINIISQADINDLPKSQITESLKKGKSWSIVKHNGKIAIPNGDPSRFFKELISKLEAIGIFLIMVGEIENFYKSIGGHGPKFVTKLLTEVDLEDPDLRELREFVQHVHDGAHAPIDDQSNDSDEQTAALLQQ